MTYEAWRISYQSSEQAARAAYAECERLRAKVAEIERQEPVFWWRPCSDGTYEGPLHNNSIERVRKLSGAWSPLYALPSAQPSYLPSDLAEAIIADMQAQYDSELITENDSCEALIRLDGAIAAVEDNFAAATEAKP